jgi:RNA polymerase sigma factor (sigma-70 family)
MDNVDTFMEALYERRQSILATVKSKMPIEQFGIALDDLWQDAIERILTNDRWRTFDSTKGALKTWMLTQVRHVLALRIKPLAMQAAASTVSLDDVSLTVPASDMFDDITLRLDMEKALGTLAPQDVDMLHMYFGEGYNLTQVATRFDVSTSTAHRRMQMAAVKLRTALLD